MLLIWTVRAVLALKRVLVDADGVKDEIMEIRMLLEIHLQPLDNSGSNCAVSWDFVERLVRIYHASNRAVVLFNAMVQLRVAPKVYGGCSPELAGHRPPRCNYALHPSIASARTALAQSHLTQMPME